MHAHVVDRHDAGVAQPCEPAGLIKESLGPGVRHLPAGPEDLDGHGPVSCVSCPRYTVSKPPAANAVLMCVVESIRSLMVSSGRLHSPGQAQIHFDAGSGEIGFQPFTSPHRQ